jgi:hypothetical protein
MGGWIYIVLFSLTLLGLVFSLTSPRYYRASEQIGTAFVILLLVGMAWPIVVSFLKGRAGAGVVGALTLLYGIGLAVGSANDPPELGIVWGTIGPVLLAMMIFPLVGAVRPARTGSAWAAHLAAAPPEDPPPWGNTPYPPSESTDTYNHNDDPTDPPADRVSAG